MYVPGSSTETSDISFQVIKIEELNEAKRIESIKSLDTPHFDVSLRITSEKNSVHTICAHNHQRFTFRMICLYFCYLFSHLNIPYSVISYKHRRAVENEDYTLCIHRFHKREVGELRRPSFCAETSPSLLQSIPLTLLSHLPC